jgi:DNA-binding response OmpR family regulator
MKKRILVVDDEPDITWMIKLNLEQTGRYEV